MSPHGKETRNGAGHGVRTRDIQLGKLAKRHLDEGARVLYDVSSSSYHGRTRPLAVWGHNRDEEDLPCSVRGLLADGEGRPVAVET